MCPKIHIIDAMRGMGKTSAAINYIISLTAKYLISRFRSNEDLGWILS